ncbi:helix-turn-helix transcriptional regulator [Candidatus Fermentibacteria bacterium]|nr:helix-turn-helix transcriptional regulator [Candidatus Fermentibacteria bacterium]
MRFQGRVFKAGRYWAIEVSVLGVVTQGRTKKDAYLMIADAIEALVNKEGFTVQVYPGTGEYFEIGAWDQGALTALLLRRERARAGLSLSQVAQRMNARSLNAYARYEQGRSVPTVQKLSELVAAVSPDRDFVLVESRVSEKSGREGSS